MPVRPMIALCALLLAGCTSTGDHNAPNPSSPGFVPAAVPHAPMAPASFDQTAAVQSSEAGSGAHLHSGLLCKTINDVTLCDAPIDQSSDDILYTN